MTDYMVCTGSGCQGSDEVGKLGSKRDGAILIANYDGFPSNPRTVHKWKSRTALKHITDGTSKAFLCGERSAAWSKASDEQGGFLGSHAFCGDYNPGYRVGNGVYAFAQSPDELAFGSAHPGVVIMCMADASVQQISKDVDPNVLDRAATRAGSDLYDWDDSPQLCN